MDKSKNGFEFKISSKQIIAIASFVGALIFLGTQFNKGVEAVQEKYVEPVAKEVFEREMKEHFIGIDTILCNVIYNQNVVIEMLEISNKRNFSELKNQAINKVRSRTGKIK